MLFPTKRAALIFSLSEPCFGGGGIGCPILLPNAGVTVGLVFPCSAIFLYSGIFKLGGAGVDVETLVEEGTPLSTCGGAVPIIA